MDEQTSTSMDRADEVPGRLQRAGTGRNGHPDPGNATDLQYHLFVERVHDYAIFLMNPDGIITHWGEGAVRMKRFSPEEAVGMHLRELYPPDGAEDGTADEHVAAAVRDGEYVGEGMRLRGDGTLFPARVTLTALRRGGQLIGFSKVTQDLSERRQVEARLQAALSAAQAASVEKSRFLSTMSHEIRTPINAVLGYADLLDAGVAGPLNPVQNGYVQRLRSSARHLLDLVEDVLDFARVESGRMDVRAEQARVTSVVQTAVSLVLPQAGEAGLAVEVACEPGVTCWADERRVSQVLVNLLGNAVKFTPPGGRIRITCGCVEPDAGAELAGDGPWTCVRVEDTGIGIAADRLGSIFEPFVQVDDELTRGYEGTGLGLAISRRLARLLGGDLTARSRPGVGSTFALWLPASPSSSASRDARPGDAAADGSVIRVGQHLSASAHQVVRAFTDRLRAEPAIPQARGHTRPELEDHLTTLLTEFAQALILAEGGGGDAPGIARDGDDVQRLLAVRHGRQRRRLGWTEPALERALEILAEEVEAVLWAARDVATDEAVQEAVSIVQRRLLQSREDTLAAFRAAAA